MMDGIQKKNYHEKDTARSCDRSQYATEVKLSARGPGMSCNSLDYTIRSLVSWLLMNRSTEQTRFFYVLEEETSDGFLARVWMHATKK